METHRQPTTGSANMTRGIQRRMDLHRAAIVLSVLFTLTGFSYNVWRMEATEQNERIRTAGFEILVRLAELEQLIYAAHYDQDPVTGNPRRGWVLVGLVEDLANLASPAVAQRAHALRATWAARWPELPTERDAADALVADIDATRAALRVLLGGLR